MSAENEVAQAVIASTESTETTTPVEAAVEAAPETKVDNETTKRMALLARQERKMREDIARQKAELDAARKEIEAERAKWSGDYEKIQALKNKDWSKLSEDLDYNDLTRFKLNDGQTTPETLIERKIAEIERKFEEKLKAKDEEMSKRQTEYAEKSLAEQRTAFKLQLKEELLTDFKSEAPKFEWLSIQENPEELVYEVIQAHYDKTQKESGRGRVLKTDEAAELVEKYLEKEATAKLSKVKKAKSIFDTKEEALGEQGKTVVKEAAKTLTNNLHSSPTTPSQLKGQRLIEKSLEDAAKLIRFKNT